MVKLESDRIKGRIQVGIRGQRVQALVRVEQRMRLIRWPFRWGRWLGLLWLGAWTALSQSLQPAGPEYAIVPSRVGDQMHSALGLRSAGGFVAWEDNGIDNRGQGIAAMRLDGSLAVTGPVVRVNQTVVGDQIDPQIGLLPKGGAVFVWAAGRGALPGIYARFAAPNGQLTSGEIKVNRGSFSQSFLTSTNLPAYNLGTLRTNRFRIRTVVHELREAFRAPAVAVGQDGKVFIAYGASRRQWQTTQQLVEQTRTVRGQPVLHSVLQNVTSYSDLLQDVFLSVLSSTGRRLATDIEVNQFQAYNQRDPALAVLGDGNLVVVWVSEQQVPLPPNQPAIVDIVARVFSPAGQPLSPEVRVNAVRGLCGSPAVSPLGQHGFTVVWNQFDLTGDKGWDVWGRVMWADNPAAPEPSGDPFRINLVTLGRQWLPEIASLGSHQMVVWTSYGQDGSQEGVFGRLLAGGVPVGPELQINQRTLSRQLQPAVAADGQGRFLVVWSSMVSGRTGFDLMGRVYLPVPAPPPLPAPVVTAVDALTLHVSWQTAPYPNVVHYELFMDGATNPVTVTGTEWTVTGLMPLSTHSFRVAYVLADGQRSELSPPGLGTTPDKADSPLLTGWADGAAGEADGAVRPASVEEVRPLRVAITSTALGRRLHWNAQPGRLYQVQRSTNLVSWTNDGAPRRANATTEWVDLTNKVPAAFYRVIQLP